MKHINPDKLEYVMKRYEKEFATRRYPSATLIRGARGSTKTGWMYERFKLFLYIATLATPILLLFIPIQVDMEEYAYTHERVCERARPRVRK